jgi:hypothetical protein
LHPRFLFSFIDREALLWITGLLFLAIAPLEHSHLTICPLKLLGFDHCPGCGLGLSVHYLFSFSFSASVRAHPLGFAALIIILHRIFALQKHRFNRLINKTN